MGYVRDLETSSTEEACALDEWLTSLIKSGSRIVLNETLPLSATPDTNFAGTCIEVTGTESLESGRRQAGRQPDA